MMIPQMSPLYAIRAIRTTVAPPLAFEGTAFAVSLTATLPNGYSDAFGGESVKRFSPLRVTANCANYSNQGRLSVAWTDDEVAVRVETHDVHFLN